jgi:hypothetical protein
MPTFQSLPRELRQEIFKIAFDDAIAIDLQFNMYIRRALQNCHGQGLLRGQLPHYLKHALEPHDSILFAPHTYKTAVAVRTAVPDVADDLHFILKKSLDTFEKKGTLALVLLRLVQNMTEMDLVRETAVDWHAYRAYMKGKQLTDWGDGILIGDEFIGPVHGKISPNALRRFNKVVDHLNEGQGWSHCSPI